LEAESQQTKQFIWRVGGRGGKTKFVIGRYCLFHQDIYVSSIFMTR